MKKSWSWPFVAAVALGPLFAASASAQDAGQRVIEEEIVLQDPTVARSGRWTAGGSFEGWYVSGPLTTYDANGNVIAKGRINGGMPGGNAFVGYGDFTLQVSYRSGNFAYTKTFVTNGNSVDGDRKQTEFETTLRYLYKWKKHFSPYALVGFNRATISRTEVFKTPGVTWAYNGREAFADRYTYDSGLIGLGAIVPFNQYLGARVDGRLLFSSGEWKRDDGRTVTGSGVGAAGTLTGYANVYQGVNIQAGIKGQFLNAKNVGYYGTGGFFGSIGYSYKF